MDALALAQMMKRLTVWLDRACQPAGFIQEQYAAAPFGTCFVSIDPARQGLHASGNWNRIHLCGAETGLTPEGIEKLVHRFRAAGVNRFFAWLSPGPHMGAIRSWLEHAGFEPRMQWTRYPTLSRDHLRPAAFRTELDVREVTSGRSPLPGTRSVTRCGTNTSDPPASSVFITSWRSTGRSRSPSAHSQCSKGSGYLTAAATAESHRQRGAQSALIARRIERARALGCTGLAVETLTMLQHSMRNLERAGFRVAYEKEIYEWSPTTMPALRSL